MSWIKLPRRFLEWEWFTDRNTFQVFLYLLLTANHTEKKWQGITIKRGQVLVGSLSMATALGITRQSLRTSLAKLKSTSEITIKSTNKYSLVTIEKYEEYQFCQNESTSKSTSTATNEQPTNNQQLTTTKNEKNVRKEEERKVVEFEWIWKENII
jgi:DNA replication protein DnaD